MVVVVPSSAAAEVVPLLRGGGGGGGGGADDCDDVVTVAVQRRLQIVRLFHESRHSLAHEENGYLPNGSGLLSFHT